VAEEAEDRDLDEENDADPDAKEQVGDGARRELDLVLPEPGDHGDHHDDINDDVEPTREAVEAHETWRRGAGAGGLVEGISPEVEHQKDDEEGEHQEGDAERGGDVESHAGARLPEVTLLGRAAPLGA
jgi:hypothetical protein